MILCGHCGDLPYCEHGMCPQCDTDPPCTQCAAELAPVAALPGQLGFDSDDDSVEADVDDLAGLPGECMGCGCTDDNPCPGGCAWVAPGICSCCAQASEVSVVGSCVGRCFGDDE